MLTSKPGCLKNIAPESKFLSALNSNLHRRIIMKKIILEGYSTYDGAGVKLQRIFARKYSKLTDPFLLLDHFGSDNPDDYIKGFPWHPHRGIETVTYMLGGKVEHGDSIGNSGTIGPGDIQWMTRGRWSHSSGNAAAIRREDARLAAVGQSAGEK